MPMIRVRSIAASFSTFLLLSSVAACGSGGDDAPKNVSAQTAALGTLTPGVIKVAVEPYAPYTTVKGGKIVGLDGDILAYAAKKLGLEIKPQVTDFAGMLAGVQSRRVDITIGGVAWSAELLVTISAAELMSEGRLITSATFRALEVYLVISAVYFVLCYPLSQLLLLLERKVRAGVPLSPWRRRRIRAARALLAADLGTGTGSGTAATDRKEAVV
ncbi:transporter substrate-binding domain-containing protein [Streptomyces sp. NPDC005921]|uniref:transporter substrate-binding domain-containing protein n=1 Tax=Streptomyces sp. NPDC005827 TaxID=3157070 RepID=UPI0033C3D55B